MEWGYLVFFFLGAGAVALAWFAARRRAIAAPAASAQQGAATQNSKVL